MLNYQF